MPNNVKYRGNQSGIEKNIRVRNILDLLGMLVKKEKKN